MVPQGIYIGTFYQWNSRLPRLQTSMRRFQNGSDFTKILIFLVLINLKTSIFFLILVTDFLNLRDVFLPFLRNVLSTLHFIQVPLIISLIKNIIYISHSFRISVVSQGIDIVTFDQWKSRLPRLQTSMRRFQNGSDFTKILIFLVLINLKTSIFFLILVTDFLNLRDVFLPFLRNVLSTLHFIQVPLIISLIKNIIYISHSFRISVVPQGIIIATFDQWNSRLPRLQTSMRRFKNGSDFTKILIFLVLINLKTSNFFLLLATDFLILRDVFLPFWRTIH